MVSSMIYLRLNEKSIFSYNKLFTCLHSLFYAYFNKQRAMVKSLLLKSSFNKYIAFTIKYHYNTGRPHQHFQQLKSLRTLILQVHRKRCSYQHSYTEPSKIRALGGSISLLFNKFGARGCANLATGKGSDSQ